VFLSSLFLDIIDCDISRNTELCFCQIYFVFLRKIPLNSQMFEFSNRVFVKLISSF
jgi:hypothetical protein